MATTLITNFDLATAEPNFERDVIKTYEGLKSKDLEYQYYEGHIVYCEEDKSYYRFTGEWKDEYGFFKPFHRGGISFELPSDMDYSDFDYVTSNPGGNEGEEGGDDTGEDDGTEGGEENPEGGEDTEGGENGEVGDGEGTEEPGSDIPEDEPTDEGTETN